MSKPYTIFCYMTIGQEKAYPIFRAKNGRQVVILIKTIMDNTKPTHIDIISDEDFHKDLKKRLTKVKKWKRTHGK